MELDRKLGVLESINAKCFWIHLTVGIAVVEYPSTRSKGSKSTRIAMNGRVAQLAEQLTLNQ